MIKKILKAGIYTSKPIHLILHVTNKCNIKCKSCFVDFKGEKYELTIQEIELIAQELKGLIWLEISGGEPFLRKDLPKICSVFNAKSISIPTNGFNPKQIFEMTKKIRDKTNAELTIAVSIDGFEKTNDYIRGKGSFKNAIKTLELLKKIKDVRVKVNTVLCEHNYDEIIDFMKYIKKFNIDFHSIIFLRGNPRDNTFRVSTLEKLVKIKKYIFKIWKKYDYGFNDFKSRILHNYQRTMYNTSLKIMEEKRQIPSCLAKSHHLVIYANGDVSFCEPRNPFGNLREENLKKILASKSANDQRKSIKKKECHCHHNCNMVDNYFCNPLHYPKLLWGAR